MATSQLSFNPNSTLLLTNSLLFEKSIKHHSRNTSKTKKPQLSKFSMLTKASACSTKGTNQVQFLHSHKTKNKKKRKDPPTIQNFLSHSLDENNKENEDYSGNHNSPQKCKFKVSE